MKHKELLAPPSPHELINVPAPAAPGPPHQRKKPHMLPPLADKRKNSVEWLPRGSPPPSWRRPSLEDGQLGEERADRPAVRVSRCEAPEEAAAAPSASAATRNPGGGLRTPKYAPLEPIKRKTTP